MEHFFVSGSWDEARRACEEEAGVGCNEGQRTTWIRGRGGSGLLVMPSWTFEGGMGGGPKGEGNGRREGMGMVGRRV